MHFQHLHRLYARAAASLDLAVHVPMPPVTHVPGFQLQGGSLPSIWLEAVLAEAIMTPAGGSGVEPSDEGCFVDVAET